MKIIDLEIELNESSLILSEILKISDSCELNNIKRSRSFFELQKSNKVVDRLDRGISKSHNDLISMKDGRQTNTRRLSQKITDMTREIGIKNAKIIEQQTCISMLEDALRESNNIAELEQLLAVVRSKDERINELEQFLDKKPSTGDQGKRILELEEALKESVLIAAEREKVFYDEEQKRIETLRKMKKLEQRILSLQNASIMSCSTCSAVINKLKVVEDSLRNCDNNRREILTDLARVVQDLLESAITEKDTEIAQLEMKGVLNEEDTITCDRLKNDKERLLHRLRVENERILNFDKAPTEQICEERGSVPVLTLADDLMATGDGIAWGEDIPATVL
nr:ELKS/Rab6-interacting/CAST family member 1-like [Danaus plexippus plexippus]